MIMKTNLIMTVGLVAMLGICGTAVDAKGHGEGKSMSQEAGGGKQHQARKARHAKYCKMLQEKYPEEMKEIKSLQDTVKTKFKALKEKAKAEHKALKEANGKGKGKKIGYLKEKYPEAMQEIIELRKTDKAAAKAKFKALKEKAKAERQARKQQRKGKDK